MNCVISLKLFRRGRSPLPEFSPQNGIPEGKSFSLLPFGCLGSSLFRHLLQFPIMGSLIKTVGGAGLELRHLA